MPVVGSIKPFVDEESCFHSNSAFDILRSEIAEIVAPDRVMLSVIPFDHLCDGNFKKARGRV